MTALLLLSHPDCAGHDPFPATLNARPGSPPPWPPSATRRWPCPSLPAPLASREQLCLPTMPLTWSGSERRRGRQPGAAGPDTAIAAGS